MDNTPDQPSAFDQWRVVPNDETLLFNFKRTVASEDHAMDLIVACYTKDSIMGMRRLCSESIKDWIVIEVCFVSKEARAQAITQGVPAAAIFPVTTCTAKSKCTVLHFSGMCLYQDQERIQSDIRVWASHVLTDAKKTKRITASASPISEKKIKDIWMEVDSRGFYRGDCVAIIDGVDKKFAEAYNNFVWFFPDAAADYPKVRTLVKQCYMYCIKCKTTDLHTTNDCDAIKARANDSSIKNDDDDDDRTHVDQKNQDKQLDEEPSKSVKTETQLQDEKHQEEEEEEDYCCVYSTADLTK
ncbi:hypothetical protein BJV82DRAFT_664597 [Fennellomyces sp. T-0311]|nr:hypothetical protein BJV82DRAFT_664597 [Fennellomyces sp. T-0311]